MGIGVPGGIGVGDGDVARAVGVHEAGAAEHRVGAELQRVEEVVVHTTVDDVDAAWSPGRAHEDLAADALDNRGGRIESVSEDFRLQAGRMQNEAGSVTHVGLGDFLLSAGALEQSGGRFLSNGTLALTALAPRLWPAQAQAAPPICRA